MKYSNLHPYQHKAIEHVHDNTHCGLFLDMGLGKTVSTLTAIEHLIYQELEISTALVIAPKRVVESVWKEEAEKWEHLRHLKFSRIHGNEKQRIAALRTKADIYLVSRDNVAWLCGYHGGASLPFDMLVIDELSSFKNPQAIRFKTLRKAQPSFQRVVGLTGTPAPNGLIDLWSQLYLLDRGERLGKFITEYRSTYFKPAKKNGPVVYTYSIKKESEKQIHNKIKDICMSMSAKDYLTLPGRVENIIKIPLTPSLRKQYDDFERDCVLELMDNEITVLAAAALTNKLLQFANGAVYDENKDYHEVHDLKIKAAEELVEEACGKPVLIAWAFRHDMERLKVALKSYHPRELKTDQDILDWNAGKIQVMLMHPASGGHGLNLQAGGHTIIWFGNNWSLELEQQFNARLDRQGQKNVVVINKLVVSDTWDEEVIQSLKRKDATQNSLMEAVKARVAKYATLQAV